MTKSRRQGRARHQATWVMAFSPSHAPFKFSLPNLPLPPLHHIYCSPPSTFHPTPAWLPRAAASSTHHLLLTYLLPPQPSSFSILHPLLPLPDHTTPHHTTLPRSSFCLRPPTTYLHTLLFTALLPRLRSALQSDSKSLQVSRRVRDRSRDASNLPGLLLIFL